MLGFEEGYKHFTKNATSILSSLKVEEHFKNVDSHNATAKDYNNEIKNLIKDLKKIEKWKTDPKQSKGNIAEVLYARTFNLDAIKKGSSDRAKVLKSHGFASVDIKTKYGKKYSLKFDATGELSAKEQSTSVFERFCKYKSGGGKDTLDEFLKKRNYDDDSVLHDPIYSGQIRIIPRDQVEVATKWLERKIAHVSATRPEQLKRYQETLDMLKYKLQNSEGVESISLSKKEAELLARMVKDGDEEEVLKKLGITREEFLNYESIIKLAMKAGLTAGVITMVLKTAPEILKVMYYLMEEGEIDKKQLEKTGKVAITSFGEGFVKGFISGLLVSLCKKGVFGKELKKAPSPIIGTVVYLVFNVIINASKVARKKMTRRELANELVKDMYVATMSIAGGLIGQAFIKTPVLGYMIGSFVGTIVGSVTYSIEQKVVMSYCVDSGFTMFGLVEQDYTLPEDIIEEIGLEVFDYETFDFETFETESIEFESFDADTFETENIGIKVLRRGVIEVHKIGYV